VTAATSQSRASAANAPMRPVSPSRAESANVRRFVQKQASAGAAPPGASAVRVPGSTRDLFIITSRPLYIGARYKSTGYCLAHVIFQGQRLGFMTAKKHEITKAHNETLAEFRCALRQFLLLSEIAALVTGISKGSFVRSKLSGGDHRAKAKAVYSQIAILLLQEQQLFSRVCQSCARRRKRIGINR